MAVDLEKIERRMTRLARDLEPAVSPDDPYLVDAKAFLLQAKTLVGRQMQVNGTPVPTP